MAMQSLGLNTDIDTDGEYADFWSSVPKSNDPTRGWNYNSGIWNPAYTNWIGTYTNAQRIQDYTTDDIKKYLSQGCTVIPLVSLGDSGYYTHWFTVYGYYETEGVTVFYIADPWGGGLREYTAAKLSEKIEETWPDAVISALTPEAAVQVLYTDELKNDSKPALETRAELEKKFASEVADASAAAASGMIDDVILPAEGGWYGGVQALHGEEWRVDGGKSPYCFP